MKTVAIIATGGTIASKTKEDGKLDSGVFTGEELAEQLGVPHGIELIIESFFQKPSMHLTFDDLDRIAVRIKELQLSVDGVVVTHGTDSLEESAYYFDLTLELRIPVVFTGSQRSPEELGSDAFINLRHAIYAAADPKLIDIGTVVVFNERIFSAKYVKKEHASNIQGFNSFGFGYLGIIDNNKVKLHQKPVSREYFNVSPKSVTVDIIKSFLGGDGKMVEASIQSNADGIILEGVGRGQVPPNMMPAIKKALNKGIKIVITTSAEEGEVYPTYDYLGSTYDLTKLGVILGKDYDSKKARIKLIVSLRAGADLTSVFSD